MLDIVLPLLPIAVAGYCIWRMFRPSKDDGEN